MQANYIICEKLLIIQKAIPMENLCLKAVAEIFRPGNRKDFGSISLSNRTVTSCTVLKYSELTQK